MMQSIFTSLSLEEQAYVGEVWHGRMEFSNGIERGTPFKIDLVCRMDLNLTKEG